MKQVVTNSGEKISGLYRTDGGSLVVDDPIRLKKVQVEAARIKEVDQLRTEVSEVKTMLGQILNILKGNSNG